MPATDSNQKILNLANSHFIKKDYRQCIMYCMQLVNFGYKKHLAFLIMGNCHMSLGNCKEAIKWFLKISHLVQGGLSNLALAYLHDNSYDKSLSSYKKILRWVKIRYSREIMPPIPFNEMDIVPASLLSLKELSLISCNNIGFLYYQKHQYKKAVCYFRKAHDINTRNITIVNNLAISLMMTNEAVEAMRLLETAMDNKSHPNNNIDDIRRYCASIILPFEGDNVPDASRLEIKLAGQLLEDIGNILDPGQDEKRPDR